MTRTNNSQTRIGAKMRIKQIKNIVTKWFKKPNHKTRFDIINKVLDQHYVQQMYWRDLMVWELIVDGVSIGVYTEHDLSNRSMPREHVLPILAYHVIERKKLNEGVGTEYAIPEILNV